MEAFEGAVKISLYQSHTLTFRLLGLESYDGPHRFCYDSHLNALLEIKRTLGPRIGKLEKEKIEALEAVMRHLFPDLKLW